MISSHFLYSLFGWGTPVIWNLDILDWSSELSFLILSYFFDENLIFTVIFNLKVFLIILILFFLSSICSCLMDAVSLIPLRILVMLGYFSSFFPNVCLHFPHVVIYIFCLFWLLSFLVESFRCLAILTYLFILKSGKLKDNNCTWVGVASCLCHS